MWCRVGVYCLVREMCGYVGVLEMKKKMRLAWVDFLALIGDVSMSGMG